MSLNYGECPECGEEIPLMDPDRRFCYYCGCELPQSLLFHAALYEVDREEGRGILFERSPRGWCEKEYHLDLIFSNEAGFDFSEPTINFCPFCGKKLPLPDELSLEQQIELQRKIEEHEKALKDLMGEDDEDDEDQ